MLRGGKAVLFTGNSRPDGFQDANVVVQELPNGPRKVLVRGAYFGRYLASGHLAYVHDGTLFAARFDIDRLELTGPSVPVLEGAAVNMPVGSAEIAFSDAGTVAYLPGPEQDTSVRDDGLDGPQREDDAAPHDAGAVAQPAIRPRWATDRLRPVRRHSTRRVDLRLVAGHAHTPDLRRGRRQRTGLDAG